MRKNKKEFMRYDIIPIVVEEIYRISPGNNPVDIDKIMAHVLKKFNEKSKTNFFGDPYIYMSIGEFEKWFRDMIMECQEFKNLNLSYNERQAGVSVDDPNRPKFNIITGFDVRTEDSIKNDFVDLEACLQNIFYKVKKSFYSEGCILCDNAGTVMCDTCILNEKYANNYTYSNTPVAPEKYSRWCIYACPLGNAICCDDCDEKDSCHYKCKDACDDCDLCVINDAYKKTKESNE